MPNSSLLGALAILHGDDGGHEDCHFQHVDGEVDGAHYGGGTHRVLSWSLTKGHGSLRHVCMKSLMNLNDVGAGCQDRQ